MNPINIITSFFLCFSLSLFSLFPANSSLKFNQNILKFPFSLVEKGEKMSSRIEGKSDRLFAIRLAPENHDYWIFCDVSSLMRKTIALSCDGIPAGLGKFSQDDEIAGIGSFSGASKWNQDPDGLVYDEGEYHTETMYSRSPMLSIDAAGRFEYWSKDLQIVDYQVYPMKSIFPGK